MFYYSVVKENEHCEISQLGRQKKPATFLIGTDRKRTQNLEISQKQTYIKKNLTGIIFVRHYQTIHEFKRNLYTE